MLRAITRSVASAVIVRAVAYIALRPVDLAAATKSQVVALLVYATLFAGLCSPFQPVGAPPLALRPSGIRDALISIGIWLGVLGAIMLAYFCFGFVFGNPHEIASQIIAQATDAQRLQGGSGAAWTVAIARGCVLVPLFEETFFRGLLVSWLRRHLRREFAIPIMAIALP